MEQAIPGGAPVHVTIGWLPVALPDGTLRERAVRLSGRSFRRGFAPRTVLPSSVEAMMIPVRYPAGGRAAPWVSYHSTRQLRPLLRSPRRPMNRAWQPNPRLPILPRALRSGPVRAPTIRQTDRAAVRSVHYPLAANSGCDHRPQRSDADARRNRATIG